MAVGQGFKALASAARSVPRTNQEFEALLEAVRDEMKLPVKKRGEAFQPNYTASGDLFDTSLDQLALTEDIFPQYSIAGKNPRLAPGDTYGKGGRMQQLEDNFDDVAGVLAERVRPGVGSETGYFYHVAPIYQAARNSGLSHDDAMQYVDTFSKAYGATSPRTQTLPNLRSATYLMAKDGKIPFKQRVLTAGDGENDVGFPMMGAHKDRARAYLDGDMDQLQNPKPVNFTSNVGGNLQNVTVDTHAIRGAVDSLEEVVGKGNLNPGFLKASARDEYRQTGEFDRVNQLDDGLDSKTTKNYDSPTQVEYDPMARLYTEVADRLNISPAEAQAIGWFDQGKLTGLKSQYKNLSQLFADRVEATAKILGLPVEDVARKVFRKEIPLYGFVGGTAAGSLYSPKSQAALQDDTEGSNAARALRDAFQSLNEVTGNSLRAQAQLAIAPFAAVPSPIQPVAIAAEGALAIPDVVNAVQALGGMDPSQASQALNGRTGGQMRRFSGNN